MVRRTNNIIRIVIVNDQLALRAGLRLLLEQDQRMKVVGLATNRAEALATIREQMPDVVVLDGELGEEDGLTMLPALQKASKSSRILILMSKTDPETNRLAVHQGAAGLVQKNAATDVFVKAIEKVHMGEAWIDRTIMGKVLADLRNGQLTDTNAAKIARLTPREREVITLVGLGLKNKEIAAKLFISEITVSHHLSSIFSKLGVSNRLDLLIYAFSNNLAKMP
jgi:two-component system, NarL family, nitrate/nitrite response regulator NarL